ncbi:MAG: hypothetical protein ABIP93_14175 [Gemmatimonadaceae bacterium]
MALRVFSTREGEEWRVWPVTPEPSAASTLDRSFRSGWLCFEQINGGERRRLSLGEVPDGWDALPDNRLDLLRRVATLVASPLPDSATPVTARRPIEERARDPRPASKTVVGDDDGDVERPV